MPKPSRLGWVDFCMTKDSLRLWLVRRWRYWRWMRRDITVDHVLQFLAGLEEGDLLGRNFDAVAGFGIASDAGFALPGAEAAKAANFNLVARAQGTHYAVKD